MGATDLLDNGIMEVSFAVEVPEQRYVGAVVIGYDENDNPIEVKSYNQIVPNISTFVIDMYKGKEIKRVGIVIDNDETSVPISDKTRFTLTIGSRDARVFGEAKENDVAPVIRNNRTMLPRVSLPKTSAQRLSGTAQTESSPSRVPTRTEIWSR